MADVLAMLPYRGGWGLKMTRASAFVIIYHPASPPPPRPIPPPHTPHGRLDMIKVAAVVACIAGVVLLAIASYEESVDTASSKNGTGTDGHHKPFHLSTGILVEFLCAIGQASPLSSIHLNGQPTWSPTRPPASTGGGTCA